MNEAAVPPSRTPHQPRCPPPAHLLAARRAPAVSDKLKDEDDTSKSTCTTPSLKTSDKDPASAPHLATPLPAGPRFPFPFIRPPSSQQTQPLNQPLPPFPPSLQQKYLPPPQPPPPQAPPPPPVPTHVVQAAQQVAYFSRVNQLLQAGIQHLTAQAAARACKPAFISASLDSDLVGHATIKRGSSRSLKVRASLIFGTMSNVREILTKAAAEADGALGISHRVPFDDLARRTPIALLAFAPDATEDDESYSEYFKYFESKSRAGVINLKHAEVQSDGIASSGDTSLYLAPRSALETNDTFCTLVEEGVATLGSVSLAALTMLQDRDDCLVGLLASSPFLSANAAASNVESVTSNAHSARPETSTQATSNSAEANDPISSELADDNPHDDDALQGMLEGEETEEESDDNGLSASAHQNDRAADIQEAVGLGIEKEDETAPTVQAVGKKTREALVIELKDFIGDWRDSLGNNVHVTWKGSSELIASLTRPSNQTKNVTLPIKKVGDSQFACGHYTLDVASSSQFRMVWRNDLRKDNEQKSGQQKSSTWVRVDSIRQKKRSHSRSASEPTERKQSKRNLSAESMPPASEADPVNNDRHCEDQPAETFLDDDLQSRLDNLLSQLT